MDTHHANKHLYFHLHSLPSTFTFTSLTHHHQPPQTQQPPPTMHHSLFFIPPSLVPHHHHCHHHRPHIITHPFIHVTKHKHHIQRHIHASRSSSLSPHKTMTTISLSFMSVSLGSRFTFTVFPLHTPGQPNNGAALSFYQTVQYAFPISLPIHPLPLSTPPTKLILK